MRRPFSRSQLSVFKHYDVTKPIKGKKKTSHKSVTWSAAYMRTRTKPAEPSKNVVPMWWYNRFLSPTPHMGLLPQKENRKVKHLYDNRNYFYIKASMICYIKNNNFDQWPPV